MSIFSENLALTRSLLSLEGKSFLITGGSGKLAHAFYSAIRNHVPGAQVKLTTKDELNIEEPNSFIKYNGYSPDYILHCAAHVNADFCETNFLEAKKNIVDGTRNVAKFARVGDL